MKSETKNEYVISINEEEAIEAILSQSEPNPLTSYQLDMEIERILKQSQTSIELEYEQRAINEFHKNRLSIDMTHNLEFINPHNFFDRSFSVSESKEQGGQQSQEQQEHDAELVLMKQRSEHSRSSCRSEAQVVKYREEAVEKQEDAYILKVFEMEQIERNRQQEKEIIQLDEMYPKINHMSMYRHQYPIFRFDTSSTCKYLWHKKIKVTDIKAAATLFSNHNNEERWTVLAIKDTLLVFMGDDWKEPKIMVPQRGKQIELLVTFRSHIGIGLSTSEVIVYQCKRESRSVVMVKNFNDLSNSKLNKIILYCESPLKLAYLDEDDTLGLVTVEQIMLFTRVTHRKLEHMEDCIMDFDVHMKNDGDKNSSLFLKNADAYIVLVSRENICLFEIEPNLKLICIEGLPEKTTKSMISRWRVSSSNLKNPQIFICYSNKIFIYKLIEPQGSMNLITSPYLRMHLFYQNHYEITQMEIISDTHLLINSNENLIVLAIPLIPSISDRFEDTSPEQFETAFVFVYSQKQCRLLFSSYHEIIYHSNEEELLRLARIRLLSEFLDELMIQKGHYREAFTLLILIYKGVNFSFKFSYGAMDLNNCIFSAAEYTISSLIPSMDHKIIVYRIAWICQLLLETQNEVMLWTVVYKKLKQKTKEMGKIRWDQILRNSQGKEEDWDEGIRPKKERGLEKILFEVCQLFVLRNQIHHMHEDVFFDFISFECERERDAVIEKVVMNNNEEYDGIKLLTLLHSKQRFYLQFYLFTRAIVSEEPDFYTPFVKIFSSFKKMTECPSRESLLAKVQYMGTMCLWFLRKALIFEKIPQGIMSLEEKNIILFTLLVQILEPVFTQKLSEFNLKVFLETYLLIFASRDLRVLMEEENESLVRKYQNFYPSVWDEIIMGYNNNSKNYPCEDEAEYREPLNFLDLVLEHLKRTVPMEEKNIMWQEFQALAFHFSQVKLSFEQVVDNLIILFENKIDDFSLKISLPAYLKGACLPPSVEKVEGELIEYIRPMLVKKKDKFYMNKLLSFNDKNISYLLYQIDRNYKMALEHYLANKPLNQLIDFINALLAGIEEEKKRAEETKKVVDERRMGDLKAFLFKNISLLFGIDKDDALNIFYGIGESTQSIYEMVEEHMGDKLNFLTSVLNKFGGEDFEMKEKILVDHLGEVCLLPDQQMLEYINKYYYPLDLAIETCERKGNLLAKAIFEERCGKISEAFLSYEKLVKSIIQSNNKFTQKQVKKDVRKYIQECIRICKKFAGENNSEENFWLRMIIFINGFIKSNHQHKVYLKVEFERMLQYVLTEMFSFLPTTLLIQFFTEKAHKLELSLSKEFSIYKQLFTLIQFDIGLARKAIQICKLDVKGSRKETLVNRRKGLISSADCDFCKNLLKEEEGVANIYSCLHSFHSICHDDKFKCLTCYYESDSSIVSSNIFGTEMRRSSFSEMQEKREKMEEGGAKPQSLREIYIQNKNEARYQSNKKKMKKYDYENEENDRSKQEIISQYLGQKRWVGDRVQ